MAAAPRSVGAVLVMIGIGAARAVGADITAQLERSPYVANVESPWNAAPRAADQLVSKDQTTGLIIARLTGG